MTSGPALPTVLFVCTGNQCRSPMAAALLDARLDELGSPVTIASAGFVSAGVPPPPEVLEVMGSLGLDLSQHRSRMVTADEVAAAELVVGMTRQHVLDLAVLGPSAWNHCFTFADALRRAESAGPRLRSESVEQWVGRLHGDRRRSSLLMLPFSEDIPDPIGGRLQDYRRARDDLARLTARLAALLSPA
jgi:protein-tyrosine phosphatase